MCVVGVGLKKVYKALIRGASSAPLLMSMLEAFSVSFLILIKLRYTHTHTHTRKKHEENSDLLKIVCKFKLLGCR